MKVDTQVLIRIIFFFGSDVGFREMVLLVHGFPDNKTALYFEWCWQHPHEAKGLRDVVKTITNVGKRTLLRAKVRYVCYIYEDADGD